MEFSGLKLQHARLKPEIDRRIHAVLERGDFILGEEVAELERVLAHFTRRKSCVTCANGTDALTMALMALGIGPGDAVITTPFSFFATTEAIALTGATPVFADIDEHTLNISPAAAEAAAGALGQGALPDGRSTSLRCRAIMPVDLFGLPADYGELTRIAAAHDLAIIEDAAQSFGASYKGAKAASFGRVSATSFFPAKPLGCYGDGGGLFTDDPHIAQSLNSLRAHGKGDDKYHNVRLGMNSRLDTLQAAILLAKLTIFEDELAAKREKAAKYDELLKGLVTTPVTPEGYLSANAQYTVRSSHRSAIMTGLKRNGIPAAVYYPVPLHLQPAFSRLGYREGVMPVAEKVSGDVLSLPMHSYLTDQDQERIAAVIRECV